MSSSSLPSPSNFTSSPKKQKQLEVQGIGQPDQFFDYKHVGGNTKNLIPKVEEDDSSDHQLIIGKTNKEVLPPKYDEETGEELVPYYQYDVPPPEGWKPEPEETLEGGMFFNTFWLPPDWVVDQFPVEKVVIYKGVFIPHSDQVREEFLTYLGREYSDAGKLLKDYYLQLQHSMGFEVPDFPPDTVLPFSVIRPASFFRGSGEDLEFYRRVRNNQIKECLVVALIHLRRITGDTYELMDNQPEKANVYCAGSDLYFLRFKAKNNSSEPERVRVRTFKAIVESCPLHTPDEDEPKDFYTSLCYIRILD